MDADPLISVIVPIYNVENYVRRCLDSLKSQTLREIEVICIDDGSTDSSGRIADEYTDDPRFRVIHTENRGLSAARNRGLDEAKADWIMFVDSDDWVEPEFCRIPYKTAIENQADMVIFLAYDVNKRGKVKKPSKNFAIPTGVVDFFTAIEYGWDAAWNRIYRKELLDDIRYPEGRVYEDKAVTNKLVYKANRIFLMKDRLYYYADRKGRISNTYARGNMRDSLVSAIEKYDYLTSHGYPEEKVKNTTCGAAIGFLASTDDPREDLYEKAREIVDSNVGIPKALSWKQKTALRAWRIDKKLFYLLSKVSGRMK